jgi:aspartyl-tRNA(Asn)/glutamyl-tRNA(Gln) amidotransferase subunit A
MSVDALGFPYLEYLVPAYYILCTAEASSNLGRYDGIRYGHSTSQDIDDYKDKIRQSRTEGFGKEVKKRILMGNYVLSEGYYDAYFKKAQQTRMIIKHYLDNMLDTYDFLILPVTTSEAWPLGQSERDPIEMYVSDVFTVLANLCGYPSISLPIHNNDSDLPLGIQILSKSGSDHSLLAFSKYVVEKN